MSHSRSREDDERASAEKTWGGMIRDADFNEALATIESPERSSHG
jgi:hypothetical protein